MKGSEGQAFFGTNVFQAQETWITDSGTLTILRRGSFREETATARDAGHVFVLDEDVRQLLKATGVVRMQIDVDTLGDSVPGGNEIPGSFEVVRAETGGSFSDDEFCAVVVAELG